MQIDDWMQQAVVFCRSGRMDDAESMCRRILSVEPTRLEAAKLLASILSARARPVEAVVVLERAIPSNVPDADAYRLLGAAQGAMGNVTEALSAFKQALSLDPRHTSSHLNLAMLLGRMGQLNEAASHAMQAVRLEPDARSHLVLGDVLHASGEHRAAVKVYLHAMTLSPDDPDVHRNLGAAYYALHDCRQAEQHLRRAAHLRPQDAATWLNLGLTLTMLGLTAQAFEANQKALELRPNWETALNATALSLRTLERLDEAAECLERSIAVNPNFDEGYNNLAVVRLDQGRAAEAVELCRKVIRRQPSAVKVDNSLLFSMIFAPDTDNALMAAEQRRWAQRHADYLSVGVAAHDNDPTVTRRLRVGYVSPNFREHCQSLFTTPLFRNHDRTHFEIYCYSDSGTSDHRTAELQRHVDVWRQTTSLNDAQLAEQIRNDRIDILVDLTMHLQGSRLLAFARRPAPVQVCWLAYPGGTGMSAMNYRISDPLLDPPDQSDGLYAEQTVRLPDSFWCYDPLADTPVNDLPAARNGHVTFGCFNNFCKVNDEVLRLWARVLVAVPGSRLKLLASPGKHRTHATEIFAQHGVSADRVDFVRLKPRLEYLKNYHEVDVALDTFPSNGHTTSLDTFWMGVPVVTLVGRTVTGRAGLAQATLLGLPELIAHTPDDYVRIATGLAGDVKRMSQLRATLRDRLRQSPLMNAPRFAKNMESAYRQMWKAWCERTEPPAKALPPAGRSGGIPRHIHQLWKNTQLPDRYARFADTWRWHHPDWAYTLWTDDTIRRFVADRRPDLLELFDSYANPICRADLGRYIILSELGGVYADLDCQCLQPIDDMLGESTFAIADEPAEHNNVSPARDRQLHGLACPSFIASTPHHPIWDEIFSATVAARHQSDPLDATGTFLLARVIEQQADRMRITRLPSQKVYPLTRDDCWTGRHYDLEFWERKTRGAYVLHHWDGTWFSHHARPDAWTDQMPVSIENPHLKGFDWSSRAELPVVSCIMVTSDRPGRAEMAKRAVRCYLAQTYENKQLVIHCSGRNTELRLHIEQLGRQDIRYVETFDDSATLGTRRDAALAEADGELICTWDDDDLYDPQRLQVQVTALRRSGASACVMQRLMIWWPGSTRLAISQSRPWEGSLLARKAIMPRFAPLSRGEDTPVIRALLTTQRVALIDLPRLYVYLAHGANTSSNEQFDLWWDTATPRFAGQRATDLVEELALRVPALGVRHDDRPLISCMMVTRGRIQAKQAIACFGRQTYKNRELVIVTEDAPDWLDQHVSELGDPRIRIVSVGQRGLTLGEIRNIAVSESKGDLICQWDDDDLYHPERLSRQFAKLRSENADACLLERWTIWWTREQRLAVSTRRPWEGSLLAKKSALPLYPALRRGEDTTVVEQLLAGGRVTLLDDPDLYIYRVHGTNTFPTDHFKRHWDAATDRLTGERFDSSLCLLAKQFGFESVDSLSHHSPQEVDVSVGA